MELSNIFSMLGGLALFLYGMNMMSNGLELAAGNKMKSILEKLNLLQRQLSWSLDLLTLD